MFLNQTLFFLSIVSLFIILNKFKRNFKLLKIIISFFASLYYTTLAFLIVYFIYTGSKFDIFYFFDSYDVAVKTAINIFGFKLILIILSFLLLGFVCFILFLRFFNFISIKLPKTNLGLLILLFLIINFV